jgi:hypothetical protein
VKKPKVCSRNVQGDALLLQQYISYAEIPKAEVEALALVQHNSQSLSMSWFRSFPEELFQRGEPDLRPEFGRCVLRRTQGMAAREASLRGHALTAVVLADRPPVSPEQVVAALQDQCGVQPSQLKVEVTAPPDDFLIRFISSEDCQCVLDSPQNVRCGGAFLCFSRWDRARGGVPSDLQFLTKLSFDGLPEDAKELEAVSNLVNQLDGELVQIFPPDDSWGLTVLAWKKEPSRVPKIYIVEIPEPFATIRNELSSTSEEQITLSPPNSPTRRCSIKHQIYIHVEEVIDRSPVISYPPVPCDSDENRDTSRKHKFACWHGTMDGTGPPPERSGGHCFTGPSAKARAGGAVFPDHF